MRRPMQGLCWIFFISSLTTLGATKEPIRISNPNDIAKTPTPVEKITRWRDLPGGTYVVGYGPHPADATKEVALAIYDKTFRSLLSSEFLKKSWIFAFGFESRSLSNMARTLNRTHQKTGAVEEKTFDQFLTQLQDAKSTIVFKKDFWKEKYWKWKPDRKPDPAGEAPQVIYLADLDMEAMANGTKKFNQVKEKLPLLMASELTEEDCSETLQALEKAKMVQRPSGEYAFDCGDIDLSTPPVKIIDLMGKYSSYRWALKYAVSTLALKSGVNLIPVYGPPQAAAAIMERVFNLKEVTYLIRHGMALSLVLEALEGNQNSPFYGQLTQQELEDAGTYLLLSRTMISSLIANSKGHDKVFQKFWKFAQQQRIHSLAALEKRGIETFPIPKSFYAIGKKKRVGDESTIKVYSLLKNKVFRSSKPANVVDFEHSRAEYRKRNAMEGTLIALRFVTIPVVNVGGFINFIFKEGFVREVHRRQIQEGGFRSLLLNHPQDFFEALTKAGFDTQEERQLHYVRALGIIEDREINQFDLKAIEHAAQRKKVENWISKKDPEYHPEPSILPSLLSGSAVANPDTTGDEDETLSELHKLDTFLDLEEAS